MMVAFPGDGDHFWGRKRQVSSPSGRPEENQDDKLFHELPGRLGGPQRRSIQSIEGSNPQVGECKPEYSSNGPATQSFSLKPSFNVRDSASGKC
jgi:hypothetical protein